MYRLQTFVTFTFSVVIINMSLYHGCRSVTDTYSSEGDDLFIHPPPLMNRYYVMIDTHGLYGGNSQRVSVEVSWMSGYVA